VSVLGSALLPNATDVRGIDVTADVYLTWETPIDAFDRATYNWNDSTQPVGHYWLGIMAIGPGMSHHVGVSGLHLIPEQGIIS
jgi:hypothetical protein